MALPINTSEVLRYLTGSKAHDSWKVRIRKTGVTIEEWHLPDDQPTESEIIAAASSQAFLDWEAEHGGDPTLTARRIAKEATSTPAGKLLVALVSAMAKNGVFGAATKQQIVSSVLAEIDLGEAD
jgi:hypothetical protein